MTLVNPFRQFWGSAGTSQVVAQYALSLNAWNAIMALPLLHDPKANHPCVDIFYYMAPSVLSLVISVVLQCVCILHLEDIISESVESDCSAASGLLRVACLAVLVAHLLNVDMQETHRMFMWLWHIPLRRPEHSDVSMEYAVYLVFDSCEVMGETVYRPATGITRRHRVVVILAVIIPKLALGWCLLYYAAAYVLFAQTNENLILNAVAATFVIDIDDIIFSVCCPNYLKAIMAAIPPISVTADKAKFAEIVGMAFGWLCLPGGLLALTGILFNTWCSEEALAINLGVGLPMAILGCCYMGCVQCKVKKRTSLVSRTAVVPEEPE